MGQGTYQSKNLLSHEVHRPPTARASRPREFIFCKAFPNPAPATKPPTSRPRSQTHSATGQSKASQSQAPPPGAPARPRLQTDKGYQHHGFSCFFFLRPITALYRQNKRGEKTSRKNEAKIAHSSDPTATTASHRKQTQNGRRPRSPLCSRQPLRPEAVPGREGSHDAGLLPEWVETVAAVMQPPSCPFKLSRPSLVVVANPSGFFCKGAGYRSTPRLWLIEGGQKKKKKKLEILSLELRTDYK